MAEITISNLPSGTLSTNNYLAMDAGLTTSKFTLGSALSLASGIKSSNAEILCDGTNLSVSGHYIPVSNSDFDIGSAEYKIRHLFLSSNSLYMGNNPASSGNKIGVTDDELIFTKLDSSTSKACLIPSSVPPSPTSAGKVGQIAVDASYLYVCYDSDKWVRILLSSISDGGWS